MWIGTDLETFESYGQYGTDNEARLHNSDDRSPGMGCERGRRWIWVCGDLFEFIQRFICIYSKICLNSFKQILDSFKQILNLFKKILNLSKQILNLFEQMLNSFKQILTLAKQIEVSRGISQWVKCKQIGGTTRRSSQLHDKKVSTASTEESHHLQRGPRN